MTKVVKPPETGRVMKWADGLDSRGISPDFWLGYPDSNQEHLILCALPASKPKRLHWCHETLSAGVYPSRRRSAGK